MRKRHTRSRSCLKSRFVNPMDHPIVLDSSEDEQNIEGSSKNPIKQKGRYKRKPRTIDSDVIITNDENKKSEGEEVVPKKRKCVPKLALKIGEPSTAITVDGDDTENVKGKKIVVSEPKQDSEQVMKPKKLFILLNSRMSPSSMLHAVKNLTPEQRIMVKQMGFGAFLDMDIETLPGKLSYFLVNSFKINKCAIVTKKGNIKITKQTVKDIFGLPSGGLDFLKMKECEKDDPILIKWKEQYEDSKYNNGLYLEKIRQSTTADDMFKLIFLTVYKHVL